MAPLIFVEMEESWLDVLSHLEQLSSTDPDLCVDRCYDTLEKPHPRYIHVKILLVLALCDADDKPLADDYMSRARRFWEAMPGWYDCDDLIFEWMHKNLGRDIELMAQELRRIRLLGEEDELFEESATQGGLVEAGGKEKVVEGEKMDDKRIQVEKPTIADELKVAEGEDKMAVEKEKVVEEDQDKVPEQKETQEDVEVWASTTDVSVKTEESIKEKANRLAIRSPTKSLTKMAQQEDSPVMKRTGQSLRIPV
ncbi:hypothetical protein C1H76_2355 [Elsinoe australis]|uniref:Uncharacterized protein n=1 Tax=Elsinoe australis TaxID=40998 RepID=A0A4U7B7G7_9PEZI|nr:hypothetical protein C1H76_2355 [Elsinoe australis]